MSEQVNDFCVCGKEDGSCNCERKSILVALEDMINSLLNKEQRLELMSKFCCYCGKSKDEECSCDC